MPFLSALKRTGFGKPVAAEAGVGRGGGRGGFTADGLMLRFDRDHDGQLTEEEMTPGMKASPESEDGIVTKEELEVIIANMASGYGRGHGPAGNANAGEGRNRGEEAGRGRGRGRGGRGRGGRWGSAGSSDTEFVMSLDGNRDGQVSAAEIRHALTAEATKMIEPRASMDSDGDGRVTEREYAISQPRRPGQSGALDALDGHARAHFSREDHDADGELSQTEIASRSRSALENRIRIMQWCVRLARADGDQNETIDLVELQNAIPQRADAILALLGENAGIQVPEVFDTLSGLSDEQFAALRGFDKQKPE